MPTIKANQHLVMVMTTQEVLVHFGGPSKVATALGIKRPSVYCWGDEPPKVRQFQIQVLTKGKLKATRDDNKIQRNKRH